MSCFGEVSSLYRVPGESALDVGFFDIRAADWALRSLGTNCSWPVFPCKAVNRSVRVPGSVEVGAKLLPKIAAVNLADHGEEDSSYVVEFFDSRDAEKFRKTLAKLADDPLANNAETEPCMESNNITSGYAGAIPTTTMEPSMYNVLIKGLPEMMCSDHMMEAMLEQAGFGTEALSFKALETDAREACVTFACGWAAERCARHFHGRKWANGETVTACVVPWIDEDTFDGAAQDQELSTDELLLMQMEAREDVERGSDTHNVETFGADASSHWSYEEQLEANRQLGSDNKPVQSSYKEQLEVNLQLGSDDEQPARVPVPSPTGRAMVKLAKLKSNAGGLPLPLFPAESRYRATKRERIHHGH
jgi:hypothetical protein